MKFQNKKCSKCESGFNNLCYKIDGDIARTLVIINDKGYYNYPDYENLSEYYKGIICPSCFDSFDKDEVIYNLETQ